MWSLRHGAEEELCCVRGRGPSSVSSMRKRASEDCAKQKRISRRRESESASLSHFSREPRARAPSPLGRTVAGRKGDGGILAKIQSGKEELPRRSGRRRRGTAARGLDRDLAAAGDAAVDVDEFQPASDETPAAAALQHCSTLGLGFGAVEHHQILWLQVEVHKPQRGRAPLQPSSTNSRLPDPLACRPAATRMIACREQAEKELISAPAPAQLRPRPPC